MKNLIFFLKNIMYLTLLLPFSAVLFDYFVMYFFYGYLRPNYLRNNENLVKSYFNDSMYLFLIQFPLRIILVFIVLLTSELLFDKIASKINKSIFFLIVGLVVGVTLNFFDIQIFHKHSFWNIEVLLFYSIVGLLYGRLSINKEL